MDVKSDQTQRQEEKSEDKQGPDTAKQGPDTAKQGLDTAKQGPDTAKQDPDTAKQEPDTAKQGPDTAKQGPDTAKQGPDTAKQGPDTAKQGLDDEQGPDDEQRPVADEQTSDGEEAMDERTNDEPNEPDNDNPDNDEPDEPADSMPDNNEPDEPDYDEPDEYGGNESDYYDDYVDGTGYYDDEDEAPEAKEPSSGIEDFDPSRDNPYGGWRVHQWVWDTHRAGDGCEVQNNGMTLTNNTKDGCPDAARLEGTWGTLELSRLVRPYWRLTITVAPRGDWQPQYNDDALCEVGVGTEFAWQPLTLRQAYEADSSNRYVKSTLSLSFWQIVGIVMSPQESIENPDELGESVTFDLNFYLDDEKKELYIVHNKKRRMNSMFHGSVNYDMKLWPVAWVKRQESSDLDITISISESREPFPALKKFCRYEWEKQ